MRLALSPHPDTPCAALSGIEVEVARPRAGRLELTYVVSGAVDQLALPAPAAPERTDELWRHTCFEAFLRAADGGYHEFNFAPSGRWAAYRFEGYRHGMADAAIAAPQIASEAGPGRYVLRVGLELDALPGLPADADWTLALTAVIELADGAKSYWALRHTPGQPDFHHADGFALELPATDRP